MSALSNFKIGLLLAQTDLGAAIMRVLRNLPLRIVMERSSLGEGVLFQGQLKQLGPDALMVDMSLVGGRFPEFMAMIRGIPKPPAVIAVHTSPDPQMILSAMRAGAAEFLYPPIEESILVQALQRLGQERQATADARQNAKTAAFFSAVGGCGGTTIAAHVASELARAANQEVLLADFDLVSGMIGFWMNVKQGYSMIDVLQNVQRLDESLWRGLVVKKDRVDVIAAPAEAMPDFAADPNLCLEVLRFARTSYDWLIADLGHGLTPQSMSVLSEIGTAYLVSTTEVPSLFQAKRIVRKLVDLGFELDRLRIVLNKVDKRPNFLPEDVAKLLGVAVETALPRDTEALEEAHGEARLISSGSELRRRIAKFAAAMNGTPQPDAGGKGGSSRFSIFTQYGTQALF